MRDLLIGTTNPGKFNQLRDALSPLNLTLRELSAFQGASSLHIEESGKTARENARIKATTYARELGIDTLAMDSGLYLAGLPEELQPGIKVRRIGGEDHSIRATDKELLDHYSGLIAGLGGKTEGYWEFAVCITTPTGQVFESTLIEHRQFVSTPYDRIDPGYPLESLQIDPSTGNYIAEMSSSERAIFWQRLIGRRLCLFVQKTFEQLSTG
jgi:inosine/xanthosine triphosphate pyrophosphatase family protein